MKRDHSEWWIDQDGRRWSALSLWRAERAGDLRRAAADDDAGVRAYDRPGDREPLHLVRVPDPTPEDGRAGRALLTDAERAALGDPAVRDRVRWRVAVGLPRDLAALRETDPALYERVRTVVADTGPVDDPAGETLMPVEPRG